MSLDNEYVQRGESLDEEAARLKILYCNFRYVYYTRLGILIHLELFAKSVSIQQLCNLVFTHAYVNKLVHTSLSVTFWMLF